MDIQTCERCGQPLTIHHLDAGQTYVISLPEWYTQDGVDVMVREIGVAMAHLTLEQRPIIILTLHGFDVARVPEVGAETAQREKVGHEKS